MGENAVAMPFYPFKVIVNLCFSNLLSAVVVKSISIVHNAYAGDTGLDLAWDNIQTTFECCTCMIHGAAQALRALTKSACLSSLGGWVSGLGGLVGGKLVNFCLGHFFQNES